MADFCLTMASHNSETLRHLRSVKKLDLATLTGAFLKYEHKTFAQSAIGFRAMRNSHCSFINVAIRFRQSGMDREARA